MVAVDSSSLCQGGNICALGDLAAAVGANGVAQNAGGPLRGAVGVDSSNEDGSGQVLGCDAFDVTTDTATSSRGNFALDANAVARMYPTALIS